MIKLRTGSRRRSSGGTRQQRITSVSYAPSQAIGVRRRPGGHVPRRQGSPGQCASWANASRLRRNAEAAEWLLQAAAAGDLQAAAKLALIKRDEGERAEALRWAQTAADHKHPDGACVLGVMMQEEGNGEETGRRFREAAERGHTEAAFRAAALLSERGELHRAERMLALACGGGNAEAAYVLGDLAWRRGGCLHRKPGTRSLRATATDSRRWMSPR